MELIKVFNIKQHCILRLKNHKNCLNILKFINILSAGIFTVIEVIRGQCVVAVSPLA